jgi:hypothetical protein
VEVAGPKPFGALTLIEGTEGETEIEGGLAFRPRAGAGESLTDIVGISGVTLIEGAVIPLLNGEGVSLTDIPGIEGALLLDPRFGAVDSLTEMVGTSGVTLIEGDVMPLLKLGVSLTNMLGIGGVTPTDGVFVL